MRLGRQTARLVREALVLGFAAGAQWGRFASKRDGWQGDARHYPSDPRVISIVLRDARSFSDIYPNLARVQDAELLDVNPPRG